MSCASNCSTYSAAQLKERITLETATRTSDELGGGTITWSTFTGAWAMIKPKTANEAFWAKHLEHRVTHMVVIRYVANVSPTMRVKFGSRYFAIKGVKNVDEANQFLELNCEEGAAA